MCSHHIIHCANLFKPFPLELEVHFFVTALSSISDQAEVLRILSQSEVSGLFCQKYL